MTGIIELDAFLFGIISAVALPLGAMLALVWTPKPKVLAALMAMGAGALLAALTIDLVAVSLEKGHFYPLALGMILGGLFFVLLNRVINSKGGFLRKSATIFTHITRKHSAKEKLLLKKMSKVKLLSKLDPSHANALMPLLHRFTYREGKFMVHEGDPGDIIYIIEEGEAIIMDDKTNQVVKILKPNDVYGLAEMLSLSPHPYNAVVKNDMKLWLVSREAVDNLISINPTIKADLMKIAEENYILSPNGKEDSHVHSEDWYNEAMGHLAEKRGNVTSEDIHEEVKEHGNASMAIWMGIMLDGIPESIVIGSSLLLHGSISMSLLAGLFLSNFPEALSSSVGMKRQKMPYMKIILMWTSIMIVTGIGAYVGNVYFENASPLFFALVDGLAAGAMLTMIAETMLPEAFHIGGSVTGLSALIGFIATLLAKVIGA